MWDLSTIKKINQKAVQLAQSEEPERDALFTATGTRDFPRPILVVENKPQENQK